MKDYVHMCVTWVGVSGKFTQQTTSKSIHTCIVDLVHVQGLMKAKPIFQGMTGAVVFEEHVQ